jgi:hypothetical protein
MGFELPNPLLNSFCRIPNGILILTGGTIDGNTFPNFLELILLILWDRGVKGWRRGYFPFSRITEKRRGGLGGEILLAPKMSSPYVTAYASPFTIHSGERSILSSMGKDDGRCI